MQLPRDIDHLTSVLSSNPQHIDRFLELEQRARAALASGEDVGELRRTIDAFQAEVRPIYGRNLTYRDVTAAKFLAASSALRSQTVLEQTNMSPLVVGMDAAVSSRGARI